MSRSSVLFAAAALAAAGLAAPSPAGASPLEVAAGVDARATSWKGDSSGRGSLRAAYRFTDIFSAYFLGGLGYGAVDQRVLQTVDVGAEARGHLGWARPFLRVGLVHQHESPRAAVEATPVSTLGGWGDGIRHRGGLSAGTGVSLPLGRSRSGHAWFLLLETTGTLFVASDDGPSWSLGGGAALGASFDLGSGGGAR